MNDDLRVLPLAAPRPHPCAFDFEGDTIRGFPDESVASALWAADVRILARSTKFHRPRGAFCFDGHCASCLIRVDGKPNVRACMTLVRDGLRCERQNAFPSAQHDLLAAADWMFPQQMDHHTLLTGNRLANRLFVGLVREMGGSGSLPDAPAKAMPSARDERVDVCIVGAGPAGLAAAATLASSRPRARILLVDEQARPGGSLLSEPGGMERAAELERQTLSAGVEMMQGASVIGYFPEDSNTADHRADAIPGTLAVAASDGLRRITARRLLYATGAYDQNLPFEDNDRPGVISARACGRLAFQHGIRPGRRVAVLGPDSYGDRLAEGLIAAGMPRERVQRVDSAAGHVKAARGVTTLRGLLVANADGRERRITADVVAVAAIPAPASELPRQHGVDVILDEGRGGFVVRIDDRYRTRAAGISCCGDVTGYVGPLTAQRSGAAAGLAIAETLERS